MLFRHKSESNELALLWRDLERWTVDSVDIFYKLLGIATAVYCKGKGYLRGKVFFYTPKRIASREKKTTSERSYTPLLLSVCATAPRPSPPWPVGGFLPPCCVAPGALSLLAPACYFGPLLPPLQGCPFPPLALPLPVPFPFLARWWWGGGGGL